jgi:hypothetical protein
MSVPFVFITAHFDSCVPQLLSSDDLKLKTQVPSSDAYGRLAVRLSSLNMLPLEYFVKLEFSVKRSAQAAQGFYLNIN